MYLSFIFGVNNSGLSTGSLLGSGLSYRKGATITTLGFAAGFLLEGWKMSSTFSNLSGDTLSMPLFITLLITGIVFSIFSLKGLPISMINVIIASYVGASIAINANLNYVYLDTIILSWLTMPFLAFITTIASYIVTSALLSRANPITVSRFYFLAIPILVFYISYSLGANNIGLLYNALDSMPYLSLIFLPLLFIGTIKGRRTSKIVSEDITGHSQATIFSSLLVSSTLLWILTQLSIPASLSQLLLGSLLSVNVYRKPRLYNTDRLILLISSWVGTTLLSFLAGFALQQFLNPYRF